MNGLKWAKAGAFAIAAGAAGLSYDHQKHLYETNAIGTWSYVVPLIVDVLALLAAVVRNVEDVPAKLKKTATWTLAAAGVGSVAANVAVAVNPVQVAVGIGTVGAYLLAENFVSAMAKAANAKTAVATVAKSVADATLAAAMAKADADMAAAVADAIATTEARVRAELAAEAAELVAEAERATKEAADRNRAARAEAERVARERSQAERLAAAEAERIRLADELAKAAATANQPVAKPATVANLATARAANGQASAAAMAILAEDIDRDTAEVAKLSGASERTVRRVRSEMKAAMVAA